MMVKLETSCPNCCAKVILSSDHESFTADNDGRINHLYLCQPNWEERAKKAEAELTACYNEIFYTIPERMPLIDKIKAMHGLEAEALVRLTQVQEELAALKLKALL